MKKASPPAAPTNVESSQSVVGRGSTKQISTSLPISLKEKAGEAANRWMAKNRSLVLRQTPVWAQSLTAILIGLGTFGLLASIIFKIDEVVTLQGQLKSIGGTVEVKTPAGGRVAEVFFKDGQQVQKGQLLIRFDTRQAADEQKTLTKLIEAEREDLTKFLELLDSREQVLKGRLKVVQSKLDTNKEISKELEKLTDVGGFQRVQYLERLDQLLALQNQVSEVREQLSQLKLEQSRATLSSRKSIDQMSNSLRKAELQLQYQNVTAPTSGVIFNPQASPEGVLGVGEPILSIVPQKGLYAEVYVPNKDIGFVNQDQKAKVRVDAFPFTQYGELSGSVSQISADALEPVGTRQFYSFPVKIRLDTSYLDSRGVKIPLKPGMAITTNLKLREKRLISLVSDLLVDQTDSIRSMRQQGGGG
ncbi:HlyD family secretion protein [Synechococcus sp. MU1611]|uniref:HlyD family secretion protein n=1 Tax=Synechococcus sp. MU1611 TaxID=2508345 RepID=UPI001CF882C5|nr:HlyD family efflux transporter periplasmic adaptor subunit [Synechococcus sp. MU1611]MCB4411495.1 HlyD family efflux transporter periplasmic adaptor subunit [Synechococcus sp. MU1611]